VQKITPTSPLPAITEQVEINATAAPCTTWPPQPVVELDGSLAGANADGFNIAAASSQIIGLYIHSFSQDGIDISASGAVIACNIIGLNPAGAAAGNGANGVLLAGANTVIGPFGAALGNVVSANTNGLFIWQPSSATNLVAGNYIGTDATGLLDRGNSSTGIFLGYGASNNVIGGASAAERNIISGNGGDGVRMEITSTVNNQVVGNYIGLTAAGTAALPNSGAGVILAGVTNNDIGGVAAGQGNRIAHNTQEGVIVWDGAVDNRILGNRLENNGLLGIDLDGDAVTANDTGDGDSGANQRQNYPVLSEAYPLVGDGGTGVLGSLNSTANTSFRIEFFASPVCDAGGFGEGATYLDSMLVQTDFTGNVQFSAILEQSVPAGHQLTATATGNGGNAPANTSEFSACRPVTTSPTTVLNMPLTKRDAATTSEESPVTIDALANDSDPNGDPLTLVAVGAPAAGTAQIVANKVLYTPPANFFGSVSFFYSVHDGDAEHTTQSTVNVQVLPVNDPPSNILLSATSVAENLPPYTLIATLSAVDVDDTQDFAFSLPPGNNDNDFFRIEDSLRLYGRISFDFESKSGYNVVLRAHDRAGATFDKSVVIAVANGNDAPTAVTLSNSLINENQAAGATVGTLASVDSDAGNTHSYSLVSGAGGNDNGLFQIQGTTLKTATLLDYETKPTYSIRVRSTDNGGAALEQIFLINLTNLPAPPDAAVNTLAYCSGNPITLIDANAAVANKRVLVRIDSVAVSAKTAESCVVNGKLTIISNGNTLSNLAFSGLVNQRNQFASSTIPDFVINVAGLPLVAADVEIEYYVERPSLRITRPALRMPAEWGGLEASLSIPTLLDHSGVKFGTGSINLPTIKTQSGFELSLSGSLVPVANGYQISADGSLSIPNFGKKKAPGVAGRTCTIGAGVTIFAGANGQTVMAIAAGDALAGETTGPLPAVYEVVGPYAPDYVDAVRLDKIRASFGCDPGIAIGSTGLFLTSLSGEITLTPNAEAVSVQVEIVSGKSLPVIGPVVGLDGTMNLALNPKFKLDLAAVLNVLSFRIASAQATVTERSFSTTINISAVYLHGSASINAWSTDGKFHFTGSGRMSIELIKGSVFESCSDIIPCGIDWCYKDTFLGRIPYPCGARFCPACISFPPFSTGPLASVGVDVGEFSNGKYGFKGYVGVLGQTVGFYVDESGKLSFSNIEQYQLIAMPTVAAAHAAWLRAAGAEMSMNPDAFAAYTFLDDAAGAANGVIIRTPLVKATLAVSGVSAAQASDVISKVNLVREGDVAFTLKARGALAFSLITPQGQEVTPANFGQSQTLGFVIAYTQSLSYEAENNRLESIGSEPTLPRLRYTPLSDEAAVNGVDLRIDGDTVYQNVGVDTLLPLDPIVLPPGQHTLELVTHGANTVVLNQSVTLITDTDYSLLTIPPVVALQAAGPAAALSELVLIADDNSAPASLGKAKVRFYSASSTYNLDMALNGVAQFSNVTFKGVSGYALVNAGVYTIELRSNPGNVVVSQPLVVNLTDGGVYSFFGVDDPENLGSVFVIQRKDAGYTPTYLAQYAVDQASMSPDWRLKLVGDTDNIVYLLSVAGPASPPVLASVAVDAGNPAAAQVTWQLTSDWSPTRVRLYINPGAISKALPITDANGTNTTTVPIYEGFPVAEYVVTDPAQLGGQLVNKQIDLSGLESGTYHLWVSADDGVNPAVNTYAAAPAVLASGVQDAYGVNAVRVAKEGFNPLASVAGAASIVINHANDFPTTWTATITRTFDPVADALYFEWLANPHPDVDLYRLRVAKTPLGATQVITAGGVVLEYDSDGQATGVALGFITLEDIKPGVLYSLSVEAVDSETGRFVRSQETPFSASRGAFVLNVPHPSVGVAAGGVTSVTLTMSELQPLFYPNVMLGLDLSRAPLGITANFAGDVEGLTQIGAGQPATLLRVQVAAGIPAGRYPLAVVAYNGDVMQTLDLEIVVGSPLYKLRLPLAQR
jgi:hypothetical protein